jgi:hypothetical protein
MHRAAFGNVVLDIALNLILSGGWNRGISVQTYQRLPEAPPRTL